MTTRTDQPRARQQQPEPQAPGATDSPETLAVNEMFASWRDSDSELPFWAHVQRGCR